MIRGQLKMGVQYIEHYMERLYLLNHQGYLNHLDHLDGPIQHSKAQYSQVHPITHQNCPVQPSEAE